MKIPIKKRKDASNMTYVITRHFFSGAERKKICYSTFSDYIELTYYWAACHEVLTFLQFLKQEGVKETWTLEEIEGQLQILLQDTWNVFTKLKLSNTVFRSISLNEILSCDSMDELILKGTYSNNYRKPTTPPQEEPYLKKEVVEETKNE